MMPVVLQPALPMPAMLSSVCAIPVVMVGLPVQQIESQIPPRELSPVGCGLSEDVAPATASLLCLACSVILRWAPIA